VAQGWWQLSVETLGERTPELVDRFEGLGALSVSLGDAGDEPIFEPDPENPAPWFHTRVTALFAEKASAVAAAASLRSSLPTQPPPDFVICPLADEDWQAVYKAKFKPLRFGERLWICPTWHEPPQADGVNVRLDPGLAFGTGTHPTTALCLEWLEQNVSAATSVLDMGCGSGVLAIAALKLGAPLAWAVDNDPQARTACRDNARVNHVLGRLTVSASLPAANLGADLVVANILAGPLLEMAPLLARCTRIGGALALSGILDEQAALVRDAYAPWFGFGADAQRGEWMLLTACRRSNSPDNL